MNINENENNVNLGLGEVCVFAPLNNGNEGAIQKEEVVMTFDVGRVKQDDSRKHVSPWAEKTILGRRLACDLDVV